MELCPVCGVLTPLHQLEAHVNGHFDEPAVSSTQQSTDSAAARCMLCGVAVPLVQLDAHERAHQSGASQHRAPSPAAPPSPSASSDVIIVSAPTSPQLQTHLNGATSAVAPLPGATSAVAPLPGATSAAAAAAATASIATAPSAAAAPAASTKLPSIMCPYGCGQWIPLPELDSHEMAHQMATAHRAAPDGSATAGQGGSGRGAASGSSGQAGGDDDWMQAGFEDTGYGDDAMDDTVAAAVAAEAEARRLQEELDFEALRAKYGFSNKRPGRCFTCGVEGHWSSECPQRGRAAPPLVRLSNEAEALAQQQRPDPQARRGVPRLVQMLRACLESSAGAGYQAYLCCPVQHFGAAASDRGWGCGWRNIQMMSSALMLRTPQLRDALYGGAGYVPDIGSLQAWLECAWASGFDRLGCESLGGRIQGDRKWIGTTEAAALLRSFGVQAQVVDFEGTGGAGSASLEAGSMVREADGSVYHLGVECDPYGTCLIRGIRHRSVSCPNYDLCAACRANGKPEGEAAAPFVQIGPGSVAAEDTDLAGGGDVLSKVWGAKGAEQQRTDRRQQGQQGQQKQQGQQQHLAHLHQPLVDWVWQYFTGKHAPTRHMWAAVPGLTLASCGGAAGASVSPRSQSAGAALGAVGGGAMVGGDVDMDVDLRGGRQHHPPLHARPRPHPQHPRQHLMTGAAGGVHMGAFAGGGLSTSGPGGASLPASQLRASPVTITGMPPLYFQHEGHSRTIIGIERRREPRSGSAGGGWVTTLLVLDPGAPSLALETALAQRRQWQRFVRRGLHTLTRPQYQLMYVDVAGAVAGPEERERLKVIAAAERYRTPVAAPAVPAPKSGPGAGVAKAPA